MNFNRGFEISRKLLSMCTIIVMAGCAAGGGGGGGGGASASSSLVQNSTSVTGIVGGQAFSANSAYAFTLSNNELNVVFPSEGSSFNCTNNAVVPPAMAIVVTAATGTYPTSSYTDTSGDYPLHGISVAEFYFSGQSGPIYAGQGSSTQITSVTSAAISGKLTDGSHSVDPANQLTGTFNAVICTPATN
jgi:hypothetical protein